MKTLRAHIAEIDAPTSVFVYGTLRAGGALEGMLPVDERRTAWLSDHVLFAYAGGAYPVLMPAPGVQVPVLGELVSVSDLESLYVVADMECRSGYHMRWLDVRTLDGEMHRALTFVWLDPDDDGIGERVESGDWLTHEQVHPRAARRGSVVAFGDGVEP